MTDPWSLEAALQSQVEVSERLMQRAGFSSREIADCTSQARKAIALATTAPRQDDEVARLRAELTALRAAVSEAVDYPDRARLRALRAELAKEPSK